MAGVTVIVLVLAVIAWPSVLGVVLSGATGADRAEGWIRVGTEPRPTAIWPRGSPPSTAITIAGDDGLPPFEGVSRAVAVKHGGDLSGELPVSALG